MPSTESVKSRATRRGSKRAATVGVTTRSRAHAQQDSQSAARAKLGEGSSKTRPMGRMPLTECLEPGATVGSKRNRDVASTTAAATPGMTTWSKARVQQGSQPVGRAKTGEEGRRMAKLDGTSQRVSPDMTGEGGGCSERNKLDGNGVGQPKGSKIKESQPEWSLEKPYEDYMEDNGDDSYWNSYSSGSSAVSSPIRVPYMARRTNGDSEVTRKYTDMWQAFKQKIVEQDILPTLFNSHPPNCLVDEPTLLHIREPATKMVLRAARFVVGISSSIDGVPLARSSGFLIDLDKESGTGTVVTTALLIRTKNPSKDAWSSKDQYAGDAKVHVHPGGYTYTTVEGELLYYQKHYNLAFLKIKMGKSVQLSSYSDNLKCGQDIFELGRNEIFDLLINHGRVEYSNPTRYERHHHTYIQGPQRDRMYDKGGPVIDLDGKVVGMIGSCSRGSFIPSSILLKCFHLWRNLGCIPRPHLGMRFNAIRLLNPAYVEQISVLCNIDEGLVVQEVSEDSPAEKCGIRRGDVIEYLNGKSICTTVELENMLLSIMEKSGDGLNSNLDLEIQVYCTRSLRCTGSSAIKDKLLTVNVSDDSERCVPGAHLVT